MNVKPSEIRAALKSCPVFLLRQKNQKEIEKIALKLWSTEVGIEIETEIKKKDFNEIRDSLLKIQYDLNKKLFIKIDYQGDEITFRLANGLNGFIALYFLSLALKKYAKLNSEGGIHYHIGLKKFYFRFFDGNIERDSVIEKMQKLLMPQLEKWNYDGKFNRKSDCFTFGKYHCWANIRSYETIEYRIGEQTFDYQLLLKRILHAQSLTRYAECIMNNFIKETYLQKPTITEKYKQNKNRIIA